MKKLLAFILALCLCIAGCGKISLGGEKLNVKSSEVQFSQPQTGDTVAEIVTSYGTIKVKLFPQYAPKAVENFVLLSEGGYYNGNIFHRVVENMLIQSGSFDGTASGGKSAWELEFEDEFSDRLHHYNGALSMANHGPDTNGSQFFFVTSPIGEMAEETLSQMTAAGWRAEVTDAYQQAGGLPALDYRYTVFGQIYDGLDVAYAISRAEADTNGLPKDEIVIESITVSIVE